MTDEEKKQGDYLVVANAEEQYSIWAADLPLPGGWQFMGKRASKSECLEYIKEVWTDMRPLSLRQRQQA
ncbi:MbtH family protein [Pseudomonas syringae group genomosp. 3]|uniref:Balhimycin biosynthetic protein MbtH n=1 Tax=Pseudomonas syringae pv. persicae TaxID=237306 RepID=A0AB38E9A5_9PSED|nr:MbtH family NRPS accessory protein [Pseudomonas syringae group genomosp. 3]SOQ06450.1 balhimycin biosynthetic protein MbtH [Pseudomonas syringae pv. persicae]SOQ06759.1 balhimycin biosynthetic protein MbtH [Pseudomonas syringae pv. persicae]